METARFEKGWTADELERHYYIWLTDWIPEWRTTHSRLIQKLYETAFRVTLMMDENRVGDGLALRTRFVYENNMSSIERDVLKARRPCSILEVMIALALRFEEEYMTVYEDENPVSKWFGPMLEHLGLVADGDGVYEKDIQMVNLKLKIFLDRAYAPDGRGGLFYIPGIPDDMRGIEIWRQMMMWNMYINNREGGR